MRLLPIIAALACIACIPPHMARDVQIETYSHRFLALKPPDPPSTDIWTALIGEDNIRAAKEYAKEHPEEKIGDAADLARFVIRGSMVASLSPSPAWRTRDLVLVEGAGTYVVAFGEEPDVLVEPNASAPNRLPNRRSVVAEAQFNIGTTRGGIAHAGTAISISKLLERCDGRDGRCSLDVPIKQRVWFVRGVRKSYAYPSTFFVRVHLRKISRGVLSVDYRTLHEMFMPISSRNVVFGCMRFDDPSPVPKVIDVRGLWLVQRCLSSDCVPDWKEVGPFDLSSSCGDPDDNPGKTPPPS